LVVFPFAGEVLANPALPLADPHDVEVALVGGDVGGVEVIAAGEGVT
jgi:hypothetical protein